MTQKELLANLSDKNNLNEIQEYIKEVIEIRSFGNQPVHEEQCKLHCNRKITQIIESGD